MLYCPPDQGGHVTAWVMITTQQHLMLKELKLLSLVVPILLYYVMAQNYIYTYSEHHIKDNGEVRC